MADYVMTDDVVRKLDEAFLYGLTDRQACQFAEIPYSTFTSWLERNEEYRTKKEMLKENPKIRAKINVVKSILKGDLYDSKWYLERTDKEFNPKSQVDVGNKDGESFKTESTTDLSKLSVEELINLESIIRKASES